MTDREKAIVMAHTGVCMLTGDKFQIFHKYVENILGRPVWTHDIGFFENEIKEKSKADFMALCADEDSSENQNKWIPVSEDLPKDAYGCIVTVLDVDLRTQNEFENILPYFVGYDGETWNNAGGEPIPYEVIAWMKAPEPMKVGEENC